MVETEPSDQILRGMPKSAFDGFELAGNCTNLLVTDQGVVYIEAFNGWERNGPEQACRVNNQLLMFGSEN